MKKLMMLVLISASIFTYSQSYASGGSTPPSSKSSKSTRAHVATKTQSKVHNVRKNRRLQGDNYYKFANNRTYLKHMGKAINGR